MNNDKKSMKFSDVFYNFIEKYGANRIKADMELQTRPTHALADIIVKYFKLNNDRYLELVNMEVQDGNK